MKRITLVSALAAIALTSGHTAYAQTYSVEGGGTITQTGSGCVNISQDLTRGSRGADVTALQQFLVGRNYPGSGSWMLTGYFGAATMQAVKNFQLERGIAQSGVLDMQTRVAIQTASCVVPSISYSVSAVPVASVTTSAGPVSVGALSVSSGLVGTSVTIYGSGFDQSYNSVYFGNILVPGTFASDGSSIAFTVPVSYPSQTSNCGRFACTATQYVGSGVYPVRVTNARGFSNSVPFTVLGADAVGCSTYWASGTCSYGSGAYATYGSPTVSVINPVSGEVGSSVTILGSGFSKRGNTVHFGSGVIMNLTSADGNSLSFVVPSQLTGYGSQTLALGVYGVSVTNENGATSNTVPFSLTSFGAASAGAVPPTIQDVSGPLLIAAGAQGAWTVIANNQSNLNAWVSVRWGDESAPGPALYTQPVVTGALRMIRFTHTYQTPGRYYVTFTVTNGAGAQNMSGTIVAVTS